MGGHVQTQSFVILASKFVPSDKDKNNENENDNNGDNDNNKDSKSNESNNSTGFLFPWF